MIRKASIKAIIVFVAVCGFSLAFFGPAQAQEHEDWIKPITQKGSAAWMLTLQGLGTFNVNGPGLVPVPSARTGHFSPSGPQDTMIGLTGVGVKYFLADDIALRVALGFAHNSSKTLDTSSFAPGMTAWELGVGAEMHFRPLYSVSPYAGVQINYGASSADEPTNQNITYSAHVFGVELLTGFDWFVTRGIAVGAEGGLMWQSTAMTSKLTGTNSTTVDGPDHSSIALSMDGLVHVVVYF